jgi:hypothetical protein
VQELAQRQPGKQGPRETEKTGTGEGKTGVQSGNFFKIRFQERTIEKIVAWSAMAADPSELARMQTRQW